MTARALAGSVVLVACWTEPRAPDCLPSRRLDEISTTNNEYNGALTPDALEIVFTRGSQLYQASRANRGSPFGTAVPLDMPTGFDFPWISRDARKLRYPHGTGATGGGLFEAARDEGALGHYDTANAKPVFDTLGTNLLRASFTDDDLTVVFARVGANAAAEKFFIATRATTQLDFTNERLLAISTTTPGTGPVIAGDGQTLFYASIEFTPHARVVRATRSGDEFVDPTVVPLEDDANDDDAAPWPLANGRTLLFSRESSDLWLYCE